MALRGLLACLVASLGLSWPDAQDVRAVGIAGQDLALETRPISQREKVATAVESVRNAESDLDHASHFSGWDFPFTAGTILVSEQPTEIEAIPLVSALLPEDVAPSTASQIATVEESQALIAAEADLPFETTVASVVEGFASDATPSQNSVAVEDSTPITVAELVETKVEPSEPQTVAVAVADAQPQPVTIEQLPVPTQAELDATTPVLARLAAETTWLGSLPATVYNLLQPYALDGNMAAIFNTGSTASSAVVAADPVLASEPQVAAVTVATSELVDFTAEAEVQPLAVPAPAPDALVAPESLIVAEFGWIAPPADLVIDLTISDESTQASNEAESADLTVSHLDRTVDLRKERVASAVKLTRQAFQAWAAALTDHHEIASQPAPITR